MVAKNQECSQYCQDLLYNIKKLTWRIQVLLFAFFFFHYQVLFSLSIVDSFSDYQVVRLDIPKRRTPNIRTQFWVNKVLGLVYPKRSKTCIYLETIQFDECKCLILFFFLLNFMVDLCSLSQNSDRLCQKLCRTSYTWYQRILEQEMRSYNFLRSSWATSYSLNVPFLFANQLCMAYK